MDTQTPETKKSETSAAEKPAVQKKGSSSSVGGIVILVIALLLVALWALGRYTAIKVPGVPKANEGKNIAMQFTDMTGAEGEWQAVFLSNGQVYFGRLSDTDQQYATLDDVYYLQVQQPLQQTAATTTGQVAGVGQQANGQQLVLIKFGTELHGPQDRMLINRDHILFWENLKSDSTVVRSIMQYKEGQSQ